MTQTPGSDWPQGSPPLGRGEPRPYPHDPAAASPPAPGWAPPPLPGSAAQAGGQPGQFRRPSDPIGPAPLRPVSIDEYAPPRSRLPLAITVGALALLVVALIGITLRPGLLAPAGVATPTPSPTATTLAPGLPFSTSDERFWGRWEILEHRWTDSGLMIQVRIHVDRGPLGYTFMAFENQGVRVVDPSPGAESPVLTGRRIPSGGVETGWVYFHLARGDATIILADEAGQQMSALVVQG